MRPTHMKKGVIVGALLFVSFWLVSLIIGLMDKANIAVSEAHDAQRQYEAVQERKSRLQANLQALETDLGQDAAIRMAFGVARPGEEVIVLVPTPVATTTPDLTWWQKVMNWF